jgi:hypothetical protein
MRQHTNPLALACSPADPRRILCCAAATRLESPFRIIRCAHFALKSVCRSSSVGIASTISCHSIGELCRRGSLASTPQLAWCTRASLGCGMVACERHEPGCKCAGRAASVPPACVLVRHDDFGRYDIEIITPVDRWLCSLHGGRIGASAPCEREAWEQWNCTNDMLWVVPGVQMAAFVEVMGGRSGGRRIPVAHHSTKTGKMSVIRINPETCFEVVNLSHVHVTNALKGPHSRVRIRDGRYQLPHRCISPRPPARVHLMCRLRPRLLQRAGASDWVLAARVLLGQRRWEMCVNGKRLLPASPSG